MGGEKWKEILGKAVERGEKGMAAVRTEKTAIRRYSMKRRPPARGKSDNFRGQILSKTRGILPIHSLFPIRGGVSLGT